MGSAVPSVRKACGRAPVRAWRARYSSAARMSAPGVRDAILGATAPDFELSCSAGTSVRLAGELAKGPVVLSWYRGSW